MGFDFIQFLKVIFLGIVEGITEWLPISSTGHMLLVDEFLKLGGSDAFKEMFFIVIQLGAIFAVILLFFRQMWPLELGEGRRLSLRMDVIQLWFKVAVACIPGAVATVLLDNWIDSWAHTPLVISLALIVYGIAFILIERRNKGKVPRIKSLTEIDYRIAIAIGMFQVLSIIPGTSRSGATIIGALLLGVSRVAAAEFTFFLAVPVMVGLSGLKLLKFGLHFSSGEFLTLVIGMLTAFVVSLLVIRFLMGYIRKRDFSLFGWYRIALGVTVLLYFAFIAG